MKLAVFTGVPGFATPQHVGGPIVEPETRERFHRLCDQAFDRNYLTNGGPFSLRLEEEVAARHHVREAVLLSNATVAQMVLMKAMGLDGGVALVSSNTFIATPHVCEWLGMKVEFCDIDPATLNLDPEDVARRIHTGVKAVIPTHVFGVFADMPEILRIASSAGAAVIADAAHAFDCSDSAGVMAGGFGVPEFVSFHATKYFSTLEGGAVLTNDRALAKTLREMRNFGFNMPGDAGLLGTNAKASEISAAFGLASLPALPARQERLRRIHETYRSELAGLPGIRIHDVSSRGNNNHRYFTVFIEEGFGLERDAVHDILALENVLARAYFHPGCHRMGYYANRKQRRLPNAERLLANILSLPTSFVDVDPVEGAKLVSGMLVAMHRSAEEVTDRLTASCA